MLFQQTLAKVLEPYMENILYWYSSFLKSRWFTYLWWPLEGNITQGKKELNTNIKILLIKKKCDQ